MKLKSLSDLGSLYDNVVASNITVEKTAAETNRVNVLLTDATQYLPENINKPGQPLGGGPAVKGSVEPLAKKTGPEGLKGNNFKEVDTKADPGTDEKVMKKEEEHDEEVSKNAHQADAAEVTTPKEKVKESAGENNKYKYQPKFTMSKLKFDQLYEEALKGVPFNEEADDVMEQEEIAPADDMAADAPDAGMDTEEETTVTITLDKDLAKKLHEVLMSVLGGEEEHEAGEEVIGAEEPVGDVAAEAVVSEPTPKEEKGNNAALQNTKGGANQVGDLKPVKGAVEKGAAKSEPTPKEEKGNNAKLQNTKNFKVDATGTVAHVGKKAFE